MKNSIFMTTRVRKQAGKAFGTARNMKPFLRLKTRSLGTEITPKPHVEHFREHNFSIDPKRYSSETGVGFLSHRPRADWLFCRKEATSLENHHQ